tara:strand:+ start:2832 stop:3266 length:435 start_codon:yes stop_codon:yes gene_type:complete
MSIMSWSHSGFSYNHQHSVTNSFSIAACTKDLTNAAGSDNFPWHSNIQSIEISVDTIASSAATITAYLCRDSAGDVPITPGTTSGASQSITTGVTTAAKGGVILAVDNDCYYHDGVNSDGNTIYCVIKTDTGTCNANIRINWRK